MDSIRARKIEENFLENAHFKVRASFGSLIQ